MKSWQKLTLFFFSTLFVALFVLVNQLSRRQAQALITHLPADRSLPDRTPADFGLPFEEVSVTTVDGLRLVGWLLPSTNGALVIAQHGYKSNRAEMLEEAAILQTHGYGVLISSIRAHDYSAGETISFGLHEMQDLDAWYQFAHRQPGVDAGKIALLGNSMGGSMAIQYAAQNAAIGAVIAHSSMSSLDDTIWTSVEHFTPLPPFPFAPLIVFWAERELGFDSAEINASAWIATISPRPVFLLHGGRDTSISAQSGDRLYAAAGEPKLYWFEPDLGHTQFDTVLAAEFEERLIAFLDAALLSDPADAP